MTKVMNDINKCNQSKYDIKWAVQQPKYEEETFLPLGKNNTPLVIQPLKVQKFT